MPKAKTKLPNVTQSGPTVPPAPEVQAPVEVNIILKNTQGETMDWKEYFYVPAIVDPKVPVPIPYFNKSFGLPVEREDLIKVFNQIFPVSDGFLFYKIPTSELYLVIIPLKYATIGEQYESVQGDFQKHAMSFVGEGSVNIETLKMKLNQILKTLEKYRK